MWKLYFLFPLAPKVRRIKGFGIIQTMDYFSVKSAYRLVRLSNISCNSREREENPVQLYWMVFGDKFGPYESPSNKVRMFLWRCSHNALAVLFNLFHKKIDISPYCLRCNYAFETIEHLFFNINHQKRYGPFGESLSFVEWWTAMIQSNRSVVLVTQRISMLF